MITFMHAPSLGRWGNEDGFQGITIGWAPQRVAKWQPTQAGVGGNAYVVGNYIRGHAWIHPSRQTLDYSTSYGSAGGILLHELGHALGLAHADAGDDSIMTPVVTRTTYSESDRAALRYLGLDACRG